MHKVQYQALLLELDVGDYGDIPEHINVSVYVTTGRQKGKVGRVVSVAHGKICVQVSDAKTTLTFPYTKLEIPDANGNPVINYPLDITGRPVKGTEIICYSISAGENSHALEIGRVIKVQPSGSLSVKPIIRNGRKITDRYTKRVRGNVHSERVIILPVDTTLVTTWVLSGFEIYKDGDLLD